MDYHKILYGEIKFVPAQATSNGANELASFRSPKHQLSDPDLVRLDWLNSEKIGGGLINVGNTCFLNSVLQCLTYCPPLYNYLIKHNGGHSKTCKLNQFCMLCEMEKHIKRIKNSNGTPIKPVPIVQRLKFINKNFQFGRQEDAHEFLRYLIDHMWKACLMNLDINVKNNNCGDKIDPRIKETTAINHIFGGYHRSQVLCLNCNSRSNTFDFFMDFILDIRNARSLEDSLKKFTQAETLEHENAYKCSKCKRKVTARKRFSVYKAPNVATFQLKRFDSDRIFGGKVTKYVSYPEELDLRPYMSDSSKSPIKYQLSAVLVHVGHSSNSGHYFCFIKNSNGFWYRMDDSNVTVVNKSVVLQQQAYILFYTKKSSDTKHQSTSNGIEQTRMAPLSLNTSSAINRFDSSPKKIQTNGAPHSRINDNHLHKHSDNMSTATSNKSGPSQPLGSPHDHDNTLSTSSAPTNCAKPTNGIRKLQPPFTSLTTWLGINSKLNDEDSGKRKLNEVTERDRFNEELDRGKTKKIKSQSRDDRFNNLSKSNPFQRFNGKNGHQNRKRGMHRGKMRDKNQINKFANKYHA